MPGLSKTIVSLGNHSMRIQIGKYDIIAILFAVLLLLYIEFSLPLSRLQIIAIYVVAFVIFCVRYWYAKIRKSR